MDDDTSKSMLTTEANMLAQGFVRADSDGFLYLTPKGADRIEKLMNSFSEEDLALLTGYFKLIIFKIKE
jgi:hypothetical protein